MEADGQTREDTNLERRSLTSVRRWRVWRIRAGGLLLAVALLMLLFWLARPAFIVPSNQLGILRSMSSIAIMSLGVMTVIVIGEIDLSFGAVYGLAANVMAVAWIVWGAPVWVAVGIALMSAVLVGLTNALLVTKARIPAFIVTLGMYNLLYGITLLISGTNTYSATYPPPGMDVDPRGFGSILPVGLNLRRGSSTGALACGHRVCLLPVPASIAVRLSDLCDRRKPKGSSLRRTSRYPI